MGLIALSQSVPEFQFTIQINDNAGNKDSVIIGYDPMATDSIDASFGETLIPYTTPFDSVFEARAWVHNPTATWEGYTKKQITDKYQFLNPCITSSGGHIQVIVFVRAKRKNFPLTVKYNHSLFVPNSCHDSTLLQWYFEDVHPEDGPYHLLRDFSAGSITLNYSTMYMSRYYRMDFETLNCYNSLGGVVTDTVYVWKFIMAGYDYYRYLYLASNVQDQSIPQLSALVYPNPARNEVRVSIPEPAWCSVVDVSGKVVQNVYLQSGSNVLDVSNVPKGLYLLRLQGKNKFYQQKLVIE
ncbi:MAG: T9SS type A sorting domain-containing protein [Bacteroidia bacterium]|nr:T9SS type A sorting domain-containing protein [Bacteroidia bacterium]